MEPSDGPVSSGNGSDMENTCRDESGEICSFPQTGREDDDIEDSGCTIGV